ncbi:MAG: ATP-binding protein [Nanoarchaeota archaeon]|nr:ATP-binding protein [Nanoarchaeota archaeon]
MILGKICGKITTAHFQFLIEKEARKFEFVQVLHRVYDYVLCQIVEIERTDKDIAKCIVIGYKDEKGRIKSVDIPFDQNTEVLRAEDDFIKSIIKLENSEKGAFVGRLEGKNIDIFLDLTKLLTKHVAILAKSGAGKCEPESGSRGCPRMKALAIVSLPEIRTLLEASRTTLF